MKKKSSKVEVISLGKKSFKVKRGALHKALSVPIGEKLGKARIEKAEKSSKPEVRRMARSAAGLSSMDHSR